MGCSGKGIHQYPEVLPVLKMAASGLKSTAESLPLFEAKGRVLAEPVFSKETIPAFDNSSVDGFAFRASELQPGLNRFKVIQRIIPGDTPVEIAEKHCAVEIMTGAPLPIGFDCVIKVEDLKANRKYETHAEVEFDSSKCSAQFIRPKGGDFKAGAQAANVGDVIDARMLMALSALGVQTVSVVKRPKVWIISTGNEIVDPDREVIQPGEIRNCTAPFLMEELARLGCEPFYKGIIRDEVSGNTLEYERLLHAALSESVDLIISTGAVSMGVHDFVTESVVRAGAEILFHKVAIRPGKPILFARFPQYPATHFFGLPGNPISSVVGAQFFIRPFLDEYYKRATQRIFKARLTKNAAKPDGLRCFFKARLSANEVGENFVEVLDGQASFIIHSLVKANAWVILPEDGVEVTAGSLLDVIPLDY